METKANFALIGAFVILAAAALMGFVYYMANAEFRRDFAVYDVLFDGPIALEEGANVRYIGIKVGEVERVRISEADPSKARVRVRLDATTPVKTDSTATIELAGITGVTFLQIGAGSDDAPLLKRRPGEPVPVIDSEQTQLAALLGGGQETLRKVNESLDRVTEVLTDDNIRKFEATLSNIENLTGQLANEEGLIGDARKAFISVDKAALQFNEASRTFGDFGSNAGDEIKKLGTEITGLVTEVKETVTHANSVLEESERAISAAADAIDGPATGALEDARLVTQDLQILINRLDRIAKRIEEAPEQLVVGDPLPYE